MSYDVDVVSASLQTDIVQIMTSAVTVLGSKRVNSDLYSLNMQAKAGSKVQIAANYDAIQAFVVGKTIEQLEAAVEIEGFADTVTGATQIGWFAPQK